MNDNLEKLKEELKQLKGKAIQIGVAVDFFEEVKSWVTDNADEELKNVSYQYDYNGTMYDPDFETSVLLSSIDAIVAGLEKIKYDEMRNEDIDVFINAILRLNTTYSKEVDKIGILVNYYSESVNYGSLIDLNDITIYGFEKPE